MATENPPPPTTAPDGTLEAYRDNLIRTFDNVNAVGDAVDNAFIVVATTRASVQAIETFRDDARDLSVTVDSFKFVAKLMSKAGGLKPIGIALEKILDKVDKGVEAIEKKADQVDKSFKSKNLVEKLESIESKLDLAGDAADAAQISLALRTVQVQTQITALDATDPDSRGIRDAANAQVYYSNLALDEINNRADGILQPVKDFNNAVSVPILRDVFNATTALQGVINAMDWVSGPLNELYKLLKPVEGILNIVGFIFNITVGPIIDFAFEALGINRLIDGLGDQINRLLPDVRVLDLIEDLMGDIDLELNDLFNTPDFEGIPEIFGIQAWLDDLNDLGLSDIGDPDCGPIIPGDPTDQTLTGFDDRDDIIDGGGGNDLLQGLGGNDILIGGPGDDTLDGGAGIDRAVYLGGVEEYAVSQEVEDGAVYIRHVRPAAGVAIEGSDTLIDVEFATFNGVTFSIADLLQNTQVATPGETILRGRLEGGSDDFDDILIGLSGFPITMFGRGGDDRLMAGPGPTSDFLYGGAGDDYLDPGNPDPTVTADNGSDFVFGGDGIDTLALRRADGRRHVDLDGGFVRDAGGTRIASLDSVENALGSLFDDAIRGDRGANVLQGLFGNDLIDGREGDDLLEGGDGDDVLVGGIGSDTVRGGNGDDVLVGARARPGMSDSYDGGDGHDRLVYDASVPDFDSTGWSGLIDTGAPALAIVSRFETGLVRQFDPAGNLVGVDRFENIEELRGSDRDDRLIGGAVHATLDGGAGNDEFFAFEMTGAIHMGLGRDTVYAGSGEVDYFGGDRFAGDDDEIDFVDFSGVANRDWWITDSGGNGNVRFRDSDDPNAIYTSGLRAFNGIERFATGDGDDSYYMNTDAWRSFSLGAGNDYANIGVSFGFVGTGRYDMGAGDDELEMYRAGTAILGDGNDLVYVAHNDGVARIIAGAGDDTIDVGFGDISVDGGGGTDWLLLAPRSDRAIFLDLTLGVLTGGSNGTVKRVEKVTGSGGDDDIRGDALANQLMGGDGDDTVLGRAGDDKLYGGAGDDTLYGGGGDDHLNGGSGIDVLDGGDGIDTVSWSFFSPVGSIDAAGFGNLEVDLANGTALITWAGGSEIDTLIDIENVVGGVGNDLLTGDNGTNVLTGGAGDDTLLGNGGDDVLTLGDGFNTAWGGAGDDTINVGRPEWSAPATASGRKGAEIDGGAGFDTVNFGQITGGRLSINLATGEWSGSGIQLDRPVWADTGTSEARSGLTPLDVLEADPLWHNDLSDTTRTVPAGPEFQVRLSPDLGTSMEGTLTNIERVIGGSTEMFVTVSERAETVIGGRDSIDIISFSAETRGVTWNMRSERGSSPFSDGDTYRFIDGIAGTRFDDRLVGDDADNSLYGGDGDDVLIGNGGNDYLEDLFGATSTLSGGDGDDLFVVGSGGDTIYGGAGHDRVVISNVTSSGGPTVIDLHNNNNSGGYGRDKFFKDIEELSLSFDDGATVRGSSGDDTLEFYGNDKLMVGRTGDDTFRMLDGATNFTMIGGDGNDVFDFSGLTEDVTVSLNRGTVSHGTNGGEIRLVETVKAGSGNDKIVGDRADETLEGNAGDDRLLGEGGRDILRGGEGDDVLFGGASADVLIGGSGSDDLYGGAGRDRFVFGADAGDDIIRDFEDGLDTIEIRGFAFEDLSFTKLGRHVIVSYDVNDITVLNTRLVELTEADFDFR